jgi:hypothetical protein
LWVLEGDAAQRTIVGWHLGWAPAREASGDQWMAPYLAQLLTDPYSATRQVAYRSLRTLPGFETFRYDYVAAPPALGGRADEAIERWRRLRRASVAPPAVLVDASGNIDVDLWRRLLAERSQRALTIKE